MRLKSLRAFRYVMEHGSIMAAAEKLHLSPPAVSRLISGLEIELGFDCFERRGRGLVPTDEAIRFYRVTHRVLAAIDHLPSTAREIRADQQTRVRLVSMPRLAHSVALPALATLQHANPRLQCELDILTRRELEHSIANLEFDIGLTVLPIANPAVETVCLATTAACVVFGRDHSLAGEPSLDLSRILDEPVIALPEGTSHRQDMEALYRSYSVEPRILSVVPTVEAAVWLVGAGIGLTFADALSVTGSAHLSVRMLPVSPTWHFTYGLLRPAYRPMSPIVLELISAIEARISSALSPGRGPIDRCEGERPLGTDSAWIAPPLDSGLHGFVAAP